MSFEPRRTPARSANEPLEGSVGRKLTTSTMIKAAKLSSTPKDQKWRRFGEMRRQNLLRDDDLRGGTSFTMNKKCGVEKYFQISQRVIAQFQNMFKIIREKRDRVNPDMLDEAFIMGNRMVAFLNRCLPRHPQYDDAMHRRCGRELRNLDIDLEYLAILIDELELRKILGEDSLGSTSAHQDPTLDVVETDSESHDDEGFSFRVVSSDDEFRSPLATPRSEKSAGVVQQTLTAPASPKNLGFDSSDESGDWDPFGIQHQSVGKSEPAASSLSIANISAVNSSVSPTSSPSRPSRASAVQSPEPSISWAPLADEKTSDSREKRSTVAPESPNAKTATTCDTEEEAYAISSDEEKLDCIGLARKFVLENKPANQSFLAKVSNEDVSYDTDSDAVDSWAQDDSYDVDEHPVVPEASLVRPSTLYLKEEEVEEAPISYYISSDDEEDEDEDKDFEGVVNSVLDPYAAAQLMSQSIPIDHPSLFIGPLKEPAVSPSRSKENLIASPLSDSKQAASPQPSPTRMSTSMFSTGKKPFENTDSREFIKDANDEKEDALDTDHKEDTNDKEDAFNSDHKDDKDDALNTDQTEDDDWVSFEQQDSSRRIKFDSLWKAKW